jgi:catechol 2,3-dioxygenase-like lactoylglutathione lyase family enzyme
VTTGSNDKAPVLGIHHIAVQTHDLKASIRLYRDVLGMRIVNEWGTPERRVTLLDTGDGAHIELVAPAGAELLTPGETPTYPLLHIALSTNDIHAAVEQVRISGYDIVIEPKDVQLGPVRATIAFFIGPNNERIEFFQTNE